MEQTNRKHHNVQLVYETQEDLERVRYLLKQIKSRYRENGRKKNNPEIVELALMHYADYIDGEID